MLVVIPIFWYKGSIFLKTGAYWRALIPGIFHCYSVRQHNWFKRMLTGHVQIYDLKATLWKAVSHKCINLQTTAEGFHCSYWYPGANALSHQYPKYWPRIACFVTVHLNRLPLQWATSQTIWGPFYSCGLTLIPAWINNHMTSKMWDEITYPFPTSMVAPLKFGNG